MGRATYALCELRSDVKRIDPAEAKMRHREDGASMVEYSLLLLLIAIVSVAILGSLGTTVAGDYDSVTSSFGP